MKKSMLGLACVFVYLIVVMSCEIPQSITIKGKPGVYISLGNPFEKLDDDKKLENLINPRKIREMMGDTATSGIRIYDYEGPDPGPNDAQAYIVHYPLAEMKLDLEDYINSRTQYEETKFTHDIPSSIANPPGGIFPPNGFYLTENGPIQVEGNVQPDPLLTIDLADMAKLVKEVTGVPFGLELDYKKDFEDYLQIRIPALGINTYIQGSAVTIDGERKLRFVNNNSFTLYPQQLVNREILIYVKVLGSCSGTIAPDVVFDWTTAKIVTSGINDLNGKYPIENSLENFLGEGVAIKEAQGYIYVNGITGATMSLTVDETGTDLIQPNSPLIEKERPIFGDPIKKTLPPQSLTTPIGLTGILNTSGKSTLEYKIVIPEMNIDNDNTIGEKVVTADLVILLPLEFKVDTPSSYPNYSSRYVKLDLGDVFPQGSGGDLFGRTEGSDNDLLSQIDSVKITLKHPRNNIIDGISILVVARGEPHLLDFDTNLSATFTNFDYPFSPQFEILLTKDGKVGGGYEEYGTLKIKRLDPDTAVFDFFLTVEAKADIDHTISFK